jgi:quinol monooxygenase YgiN
MKSAVLCLGAAAMLAGSLAAQTTSDQYLDYTIIKVKPEKHAEFEALGKKIAEANRKNHGDNWMAYHSDYGENNTFYFVGSRRNMGAIDTGMEAFMKALKESYGAGSEGIFQQINDCTLSSRGELRRRRWDLSTAIPEDPDGYAKVLGAARWIRTTMIRVRPGRGPDFEKLVLQVKAAAEKHGNPMLTSFAQLVAGQPGTIYYASNFAPNMGGFDNLPTFKDLLGDEFDGFQKGLADTVLGTETMIARFMPALSNPPEAVVNVSRDFWIPPATPAAMATRTKKK